MEQIHSPSEDHPRANQKENELEIKLSIQPGTELR